MPWSPPAITAAIRETVAAAGYADAYIRPVAWRGDEAIGIDPAATTVHLAIAVLSWPPRQKRPLALGLSQWVRPAATMTPVQAKASAHYLIGSLAISEAKRSGYDDAVLLDHRGHIAEATGANIFLVHQGLLTTPTADTFLNGITRQTILRLAHQAGIPVQVGRVTPDDLAAADEVFLTGTAIGVQPVRSFLKSQYGQDRPITTMLADLYRRVIATESDREESRAVPSTEPSVRPDEIASQPANSATIERETRLLEALHGADIPALRTLMQTDGTLVTAEGFHSRDSLQPVALHLPRPTTSLTDFTVLHLTGTTQLVAYRHDRVRCSSLWHHTPPDSWTVAIHHRSTAPDENPT